MYLFFKRIKWLYQRIVYGYSDVDLWNLDFHLARVILKRLRAYKTMRRRGYPPKLTEEKWELILDRIINSFQLYLFDEETTLFFDVFKDRLDILNNINKEIQRGIDLFAKYFGYLWD